MVELELEEGGLATTLLARARMLRTIVEMYIVALQDGGVGVGVESGCRVQKCSDETSRERQHGKQHTYRHTIGLRSLGAPLSSQDDASLRVAVDSSHEANEEDQAV